MSKNISGTKEWAKTNANCIDGCEHNCRYCYARANAVRYKRPAGKDWATMRVNVKALAKPYGKRSGRIMFPTAHDITPAVLGPCLWMLHKMLAAGNEVLIVTKPHMSCVRAICAMAAANTWQKQILFRFTIGAVTDALLEYWEPHAPGFLCRRDCLEHACHYGFATSVSAEPLLEPQRIDTLIIELSPHVTDAIWIGKMNHIRQRVKIETEEDERRVREIEEGQTDEKIRAIYERYKNNPQVKWKESIKDIVGLERATEAGADA